MNCARAVTTTAGRPRSIRIDIRAMFKDGEAEVDYVTREEILTALFDKGITKDELQGIEIKANIPFMQSLTITGKETSI